jgi:hypothetical protein
MPWWNILHQPMKLPKVEIDWLAEIVDLRFGDIVNILRALVTLSLSLM